LHSFTANPGPLYTNADGVTPLDTVIFSDNIIYGTTGFAGPKDSGNVFKISLSPVTPPRLAIETSGANLVLSWPATSAGVSLQSTTDLGPSAVWKVVTPEPTLVDGQNRISVADSASRIFYRLGQ
jgi:hypothetical protein